jgi:hypothetical protein
VVVAVPAAADDAWIAVVESWTGIAVAEVDATAETVVLNGWGAASRATSSGATSWSAV